MTEINERPFEERQVVLLDWFEKIGKMDPTDVEAKDLPDADKELIKGILVELGANFEISEDAKTCLGKYKNVNKRPGLDAVWGKEIIDGFKEWIKTDFIPQFEKRTGREFPSLYDRKTDTYDGVKHSGSMQFLGELTAFAADKMTSDDYKRLTRSRLVKGIKMENMKPGDSYEPSRNSCFLPSFPQAALKYLADHKSD
jgi:hypothetical protein